jgi:hypothetical protein
VRACGQNPVADSCEYGNEILGIIKGDEFLDHVSPLFMTIPFNRMFNEGNIGVTAGKTKTNKIIYFFL